MADAVEGAFTKVASSMDRMEFFLVEVAVGVCLEFLFFCLEDGIIRFYLLK